MKSNKNQSTEKDPVAVYATTPLSRIQHEMPVEERFESVTNRTYGKVQDVIIRRFSLDSNGGGYAGL